MRVSDRPGKGFNKKLFCLYQATSDDLMVWCWFDVLILSMNYGLNMTQISLVFSVSFWVALAMKFPGNLLAKKIKAGRSVLLSSVLFLSAALFLTFGGTLPFAIIGQSIYLIAASFQEMSTVIVKQAAEKDPAHVDYMRIMSASGAVFSVISLIAAVFMTRLYDLNKNLPMYICVGFCISSCIMAFFVSRYYSEDMEEIKENKDIRREVLPGLKIRSFDRTTISCLFLSVLFMVIFTVAGDNLKIVIENDLSSMADNSRTVFIFSMILLGSRGVKILSNLLIYYRRNRRLNSGKDFSLVVVLVVMIGVLAFSSRWGTGRLAVILAVAAFMIRVLAFDPFRFSIYDFMLKRMKDDKMVDVIFAQSAGNAVFTALFSTISTILLGRYGMQSVMLMLLIVSIVFATGYCIARRHLIRTNGSRKYLKWKRSEIESSDDLINAAAVIMMHYGIVTDPSFTPRDLAGKISSVEDIDSADSSIRFNGFCDYNEETLKDLFFAGHPCAVKAAVCEDGPEYWVPVMYLDEDGGVVWNPYSKERFTAQFYRISKIASFTVS